MTAFDDDTALVERGDGRFEGNVRERWWVQRGPNGGYLAAIVLRAMAMTVDDPARMPCSLTVHYLRPPTAGPAIVDTTVERAGRGMTTVSARLGQDGRVCAVALAASSTARAGFDFDDMTRPDVAPPSELAPPPRDAGQPFPPIADRFDTRWGIGGLPYSQSDEARVGGWIRLSEPRPVDHLVVAAYTDAWIPSVFSRLTTMAPVPTVDLTVHFRAPLPHPSMAADDYCLVEFRSSLSARGFMEEDGLIWAPDGTLLAQSRQLALAPSPG